MSVTCDTCHDLIGPRGPLEQSLDSFKHSTIAARSSFFDLGAHPAVGYYNRQQGHTVTGSNFFFSGGEVNTLVALELPCALVVTRAAAFAAYTNINSVALAIHKELL